MTVADDLEAARAALVMINPAPYNAEAPPDALAGEITPTELHYVRSNFAVPDHDGTLEIGGAVEQPDDPDPRRPARACRPTSTRSRSSAPATGASTCGRCRPASPGATTPSPPPAGRAPCCTRCSRRSQPAADGVEVRFEGADHGAVPPARRSSPTPTRTTSPSSASLPLAARRRPGGGDPDRLRDERRAARARPRRPVPADRAALVRRRLGEVAEAHRRPHRAVRRRVPDRPLHVRVARPAPRAGRPHAGARPHHRPGARRRPSPPGTYTVRGKAWSGTGPDHPRRRQPHRRRRLAARRSSSRPTGPYQWQDWSLRLGRRPTSAGTPCAPGPPTPPATSSPTSRRGTGSATATTPSRSSTSTSADHVRQLSAGRRGGPTTNVGRPR